MLTDQRPGVPVDPISNLPVIPHGFDAKDKIVLKAHINMLNLEDLASRKAADTFRVIHNKGEQNQYIGETLRRELYTFKLRANNASEILSVWHEEKLAQLTGMPLRCYSGVKCVDALE